jgi:TctA family transporter
VAGDTFAALETARGLTTGTLAGLNPGVNPNTLAIGQTIKVPCP